MSVIDLGALLADPGQAGAYFVDAHDREALVEAGAAQGFAVLPVDLRGCDRTDDALRAIADALRFPDWFGGNLDALADCLGDLSWLPATGYLLLLDHSDDWRARAPAEVDTVLAILNDAALRWAGDGTPFWAFLSVSGHELDALNA